MEYFAIVGMVLLFVLPIWAYMVSMQQQTGTQLSLSYASNTAKQIADTASLVYSQGPPAKIPLRIYIPDGVTNISIINNTIILNMTFGNSYTYVYATSKAQMNGTLPITEGYYTVYVTAVNDHVNIEI